MITLPLSYSNVSVTLQHAVQSIIRDAKEEEENSENLAASTNASSSSSDTVCSLLEKLVTTSMRSTIIGSKSSHLFVYSAALQCAALADWDATKSLTFLGFFLEMSYEWDQVLQVSPAKPAKKPRRKSIADHGAYSNCIPVVDCRVLAEQAEIYAKGGGKACCMLTSNSEMLSFLLEKLSDEWINNAYYNIKQSLEADMLNSMSPIVGVIFRNSTSLNEECEYQVSKEWSVDMVLSVFTTQEGHHGNNPRFLLPTHSQGYVQYSQDATRGSMALGNISAGNNCVVIYYMYVLEN